MTLEPLLLAGLSVIILFATAVLAMLMSSGQRLVIYMTCLFTGVASLLAAIAGFEAVRRGATWTYKLPIGLPDLPFYLRLDPLSGFFLFVAALLCLFVSIYSAGYLKGFLGHRSLTPLAVFYSFFLAGMFLVLLSDDAYFFMISWEMMAASSYFLVCFEDEHASNRRAAFIYLLIAHIGAVFILLSFGMAAGFAAGFENFSGYTFSAMRTARIPAFWASAAFLLAFFGFAAKAGAVPLHVWLPEAHPVAPSSVSAVMSGVMLKVAVYGIIRFIFDILHISVWWWGGLVLVIGLVSAVMGIIYALNQNDLKRLLAYSSVENIGIILICLGLAMIFSTSGMPLLASLALVAGLYHVINHAMFKGLLFMGAGAVLHATHQRSMEGLGGLIHKMPWTSLFFLAGCLSISALPPFNGFVSEWLIFQTFLLSPVLSSKLFNLLIPLGAALLALTAALAARCFVKVYGVTFLGQWRGEHHTNVREASAPMIIGMGLTALACLGLGVLPSLVIGWLDVIPEGLFHARIGSSAGAFGWMWLTPVAAERASYSAPMVFLGIAAVIAVAYVFFHGNNTSVRKAPIWDCGFEKLTNRMQYNSTSFSMPMRRVFGFLLIVKESVKAVLGSGKSRFYPQGYSYNIKLGDRVWHFFYRPIAEASFWIARRAGRLQHGRIQIYLLYSFITLIVLLMFA